MPQFSTESGQVYDVTGKHLVWYPQPWDGEEPPAPIRVPLRIKLGKLLDIGEDDITASNAKMLAVVTLIAPSQVGALRELDVNEFGELFKAWLETYQTFSGVSLGEALPSPDGSVPAGSQPLTISVPGSVSG